MSDYDSFDDDTGSEFSFEDDSEVELHDKESDDHSLHGARPMEPRLMMLI